MYDAIQTDGKEVSKGIQGFDSKFTCNKESETHLTVIPILGDPQSQMYDAIPIVVYSDMPYVAV